MAADDACEEIDSLEAAAGRADAVAHRVVHGGPRFRKPVLIDRKVRARIFELESLAPLHNGAALRGIEEADVLAALVYGCSADVLAQEA